MDTQRAQFPWLVRLTRRAMGLTQDAVAGRVGISKGALSRYESGDVHVLGDATLRSLCAALELAVPGWLTEATAPAPATAAAVCRPGEAARYYCPAPFCRMSQWFVMPGWVRFVPQLVASVPGAEVACPFCGAAMHSDCPHCGAALEENSGVCSACGSDYVPQAPLNEQALMILQMNGASAPSPVRPAAGLPFRQPLVRREGDKVPAGAAASGRG